MKELVIPLLEPTDIKVRVSKVTEEEATLLLYKDARIDQATLDSMVTPFGWKDSYQDINRSLYCTVEIYDDEKKEWIGKSDVGQETSIEKEKGQASDAFKRACTKWGIGRELYSAPIITVGKDKVLITEKAPGTNDFECKNKFAVKEIAYDNRRISHLVITSEDKEVFVFDKGAASPAKPAKVTVEIKEPLTPDQAYDTVVSVGSNAGKKLKEIYNAGQSEPIIWIAENDSVAGEAAKLIISRNASLTEKYKAYKEGKK